MIYCRLEVILFSPKTKTDRAGSKKDDKTEKKENKGI